MVSLTWIQWFPPPLLLLWFLHGSFLWRVVQSSTIPQLEETSFIDQDPVNSSSTDQDVQDATMPIEAGFPLGILIIILVVVFVLLGSLGVWLYKRRPKTRSKNVVSLASRKSTHGSSSPNSKSSTKGTSTGFTNSAVEKPKSSHRPANTPGTNPGLSLSPIDSENSTSATRLSSSDIHKAQKTKAPWTTVPQSKHLRPKASLHSTFSIKYVPTPYDNSGQSLESTSRVTSSMVSKTEPVDPVAFAKMIFNLEEANPNRKHMAPPSMMPSMVGPTSTTPLSEVKPKSLRVQPLPPPSMLPSSNTGPTSSVVTDKVKVGVATSSHKTQVPAESHRVKPRSVEIPDFTREAQKLFGHSPQGERKTTGQSTVGQPESLLTSKVLGPPSQVNSTLKAKDTPLLRSTSIASVRTKDPKSSNSPKSKKN